MLNVLLLFQYFLVWFVVGRSWLLLSHTSKWSNDVHVEMHCIRHFNLFQFYFGIPTYTCIFKRTFLLLVCILFFLHMINQSTDNFVGILVITFPYILYSLMKCTWHNSGSCCTHSYSFPCYPCNTVIYWLSTVTIFGIIDAPAIIGLCSFITMRLQAKGSAMPDCVPLRIKN